MADLIKPSHYKSGGNDLIAKWHATAPDFDTFAFAMYTHIDKYVYRHLNKNGIQDLDKASEFIKRLREYEVGGNTMTDYESRLELTQAEYIELKRETGHGSVPVKEVVE